MTRYFFMRHLPAIACLGIVLLVSLIPLIPVVMQGGGPHISPLFDGYYVPMAREVADGYPLVGNPFYFEHRDAVAPAMILPFWLYALPLFAGIPVTAATELNFIAWSLLFGLILYALFRKVGLSGAWAAAGTVLSYMQVYGEMSRAVSMELVHPVFLLLMLAFFLWWERPAEHRRDAFLGFASALAVYQYPYLLHIAVIFLGLVFARLLAVRDWTRVRHMLFAGAYATLLCIPFLIVTYRQLTDPHYFESLVRIGLGYTHLPAGESFLIAGRILALALLAYVSWRWIFRARGLPHAAFMGQYLLLGAAIWLVSVENVVTGLDNETASHAVRFVTMWLVVGGIVAAYHLFTARRELVALPLFKKAILGFFALGIVLALVPRFGFDLSLFNPTFTRESAEVLPALEWLDRREAKPTVVWTDPLNGTLFSYIAGYTKHYVLFDDNGNLQLLPTSETEERYLVASSLSDLTLERIASDVWIYDGVGAAVDTPNTINRGVKICRLLRFFWFGVECGTLVDSRTLYVEHYADMYQRYITDIRPHLREKLEKFHVAYIMKDLTQDADFHPERLPFVKEAYNDGRFVIYALQ